jgi:ABC-2 type transport system permease protein
MNDGIADVLVRGQGPGAVWLPCLVLLAFAVVVGAAATRVFRWESR